MTIHTLAWCTDIHLNFLGTEKRKAFYDTILEKKPSAVMITGDIAEGTDVIEKLDEMQKHLSLPIYFVFGNHDFWHATVQDLENALEKINNENLHYLNQTPYTQLSDKTILVGVDGWADGRLGDYAKSTITLWDCKLIPALREGIGMHMQGWSHDRDKLLANMQKQADDDAQWLYQYLKLALEKKPERIIVAIHIPPFREASKYRGEISNDDFLPFYASKATGDVLLRAAVEHPKVIFDVFCGHTHGAASFQAAPNLCVEAGAAEYNHPIVQWVIDV
jgi:predicted phosphohydrolase